MRHRTSKRTVSRGHDRRIDRSAEGTFVADFHRSGGITVETARFRNSDMAAGVVPVVGQSYRSVGTFENPRIRPLTEEDERELFNQDTPPEVADALESLRRIVAASNG